MPNREVQSRAYIRLERLVDGSYFMKNTHFVVIIVKFLNYVRNAIFSELRIIYS